MGTEGRKSLGFRTALAGGLALAATAALGLASTDALVERGFASAFEKSATAQGVRRSGPAPVAGSEDFWLSQHALQADAGREVTLALWPASVKLGTTLDIVIGGSSVTLEVVDITELSAAVTRVDTRSEIQAQAIVVTLRQAGKATGPLMRFVVDARPSGTDEYTVVEPRTL